MASVQIPGPIFSSPYYYDSALTPESMMVYLTTRLGSVDAQIQQIFTSQQQSEKLRSAVNQIKELLNSLKDSSDKNKTLYGSWKVLSEVVSVIDDEIAQLDPGLAKQLKQDLERDGYILEGKESQHQTLQIENTREYLDDFSRQLESTAEMNMIQLQSLMSARQTAISLATNLIAKLHESTAKVVDNIR